MTLPDADMLELVRQTKHALRRRMRALRRALPSVAVARRSARVVERLVTLDEVAAATRVGLYWPIPGRGEVELRELDTWLRGRERAVFYPFLEPAPGGHRTGFRRVQEPAELQERGRGFPEPDPSAEEASPGSLEVVIVPALAIAASGHRLGYGSGFYDVTLPEHCPPGVAIVVAHHFQLLAELPVEPHDQPATIVVTDEVTLRPTAEDRRVGPLGPLP